MLPITKKITQINSGSRNGNSIQYIVCHYTGNVTDSARSNATYFYSEYRGASAHYFVDDNSIYQVVEDNRCSWAVGDGHGIYGITNQNSISIEMCCTNKVISEKTENNVIELVKYLMDKYKIDINHVVRHYDASHKICPNWSDNNWNRWTKFKNKLISGNKESEVNRSMYLFSKNWYLYKYPDVAASNYKEDPYLHYEKYGKSEGRLPIPPIPNEYNEGEYLELNPDVAAAIKKGVYTSGIHHYISYGFKENRKVCKEK